MAKNATAENLSDNGQATAVKQAVRLLANEARDVAETYVPAVEDIAARETREAVERIVIGNAPEFKAPTMQAQAKAIAKANTERALFGMQPLTEAAERTLLADLERKSEESFHKRDARHGLSGLGWRVLLSKRPASK